MNLPALNKHLALLAAIALAASTAAHAATSLTQNNITWTFDKDYPVGQFVNGDWYVVGPAKIISIENDLNDKTFLSDAVTVNGSMINPKIDMATRHTQYHQGYDERLWGYLPELNAARPNGKPLAKDNPLELKPNDSLVSVVSWLWRSREDREEGSPRPPADAKVAPDGGGARPSVRTAAVLTCLKEAPKEGTFRPPYAGDAKPLHNVSQLRLDLLRNLDPAGKNIHYATRTALAPGVEKYDVDFYAMVGGNIYIPELVYGTALLWLDHIPTWYGGQTYHPYLTTPNYGREICHLLASSMLALHLDWNKLDVGKPEKTGTDAKMPLLINIVQLGIDFTGIADAGGYWQADGGHNAGRKPTILFAGLMLDDKHMMNVGHWKTEFQDDGQTLYITEEIIARSQEKLKSENTESYPTASYTPAMLGMPEWQFNKNSGDPDPAWSAGYRVINASYIPALALSLLMFEDGRKLFNHDPWFDYADRVMSAPYEPAMSGHGYNSLPNFARNMWRTYRATLAPAVSPDTAKWGKPEVVDIVTAPRFNMWSDRPRGFAAADTAIRMTVTHPTTPEHLARITKDTLTVTHEQSGDPVPVDRIDIDPEAKHFTLHFADGALKTGRHVIKLAPETYAQIRDTLNRQFATRTATFIILP